MYRKDPWNQPIRLKPLAGNIFWMRSPRRTRFSGRGRLDALLSWANCVVGRIRSWGQWHTYNYSMWKAEMEGLSIKGRLGYTTRWSRTGEKGQHNMQWHDFKDTHISTALVTKKKHKGHSVEMHTALCWESCEIHKATETQSETCCAILYYLIFLL